MKTLSDDLLLFTYKKAIQLKLDCRFIYLLELELLRRTNNTNKEYLTTSYIR